MGQQLFADVYLRGKGPFLLYRGQRRTAVSDKLTHNSMWFNADGEELGYGDLSADDFSRILAWVNKDELFIVVPPEHTPCPPDKIWMHAKYIIRTGVLYEVIPPRYEGYHPAVGHTKVGGMWAQVLTQAEAETLVAKYRTKK